VCHLNDPVPGPSRHARLPIFDKSLFAGAGDRSDQTVDVEGPLDVFVLEGWSMGFMPLPEEELREFYSGLPSAESSVYHQHPLQTLEQINENLRDFAASIYPLFDCQINIRPTSYRYVYDWRLQQEHHMKQRTGGKGMSDDEVERFVDRYMSGYELYAGGVDGVGIQPSNGKPTLTLTYGKDREVLRVDVV
jgi:pantothenate kinase-related protein Tda10